MKADLHLHSLFSDGTYTPEEIAAAARRNGIGALSLTDHDTVEGCARMAAACAAAGIEYLTGMELTAAVGDRELHILGYGFDPGEPRLLAALAHFQEVRVQRIREMCERLQALGVPLPAEAVFRLASCRSPGRPHIARALVEGRHCGGFEEAFERFLKKGRPAWVPKARMTAAEAIALIHGAGGAAVLAHPALNHCDDLIPALAASGLDGIECYHSRHTPSANGHYLALARAHGLVATGGSDCHGMNKGRPLIGSVTVPYALFEQLKLRAGQRLLERASAPAAC